MRLIVTTPLSVLIDVNDVKYVRAEDDTGSFGILPGHADFLTFLSVSVITWRGPDGKEHHIAVRGGIFRISEGDIVEVATREAVEEDTLAELGDAVLKRLRLEDDEEKKERTSSTRLQLAAVQYIQRYLEAGRGDALHASAPYHENQSGITDT